MRVIEAVVAAGLLAATLGVPAAGSAAEDLPSARFHVALNFNGIAGEGWLADADLTVAVDNPTTPQTQDYVFTVRTDATGAFHGEGLLPAGYADRWVITVTDGVSNKSLEVAYLTIAGVDLAADIISGTADPGAEVGVSAGDDVTMYPEPPLFVAADGGMWVADLGGIYDIQPGDIARALIVDPEGDMTFTDWQVPETLDDLLDDMVADGRLPSTGLATSIAKQAKLAPAPALVNHLGSLVRYGVITQQTMDQILAFIAA